MTDYRDELKDFQADHVTLLGATREVFRLGEGPCIIIIPEIPGITPEHAALARRIASQGYTTVSPSVFGSPGKPMTNSYAASSIIKGCVSKEFAAFATGSTRPITLWLRALAEKEHARCGGPGVGVIGMCFTGGFGLAMMLSDSVIAPVMSQPSLPLPIGAARRADIGIAPEDLKKIQIKARAGACIMGLRFTEDRAVPAERFASLREALGDAFISIEIDSSPGNKHGFKKSAHSVLTHEYSEDSANPANNAFEKVLDFFEARLRTS